MPFILHVKEIDEVSLVDRGASGNELTKPAIVIAKRRGEPVTDNQKTLVARILKALGVQKGDVSLDEVLAKLSEMDRSVILNALEAAAGKAGEHPMPDEEEEEKRRAALAKAKDEADKLRKELEATNKRLAAIEDEREIETFVAKAQAFKHLPGASVEDIAKTLRTASKSLDGETYGRVLKMFESASAAVQKSNVFSVPGVRGAQHDNDAMAKIKAIAKKLVTDGAAKSEAAAMAKAIQDNPGLYDEYKAEMNARARA